MKTAAGEEEGALMRRSVKGLLFGGWEEKAAAAATIRDFAKADAGRRRALAELGVVPPLVFMIVEAAEDGRRRLALEALLELANGSFTNRVLMVEAGLLTNLPKLMKTTSKQELALLLLSISSLAKTHFPVDLRPIVSLLLSILTATNPPAGDDALLACTAALHNLSLKLDNTKSIVSSGTVHVLVKLCINSRTAEEALAALGNIVLSEVGKKAIEDEPIVPEVFVEILERSEEPKCQELAAYLLMVLARRSPARRQRMLEAGIVPVLLELVLLGSSIARQRALRMIQWFKEERQIWGDGRVLDEDEGEMKQCRRAVRRMVRESLDKNMDCMLKRGNESSSSFMKAIGVSSSSKSLPY
ncbi:U-box domain-containing protein 2 [Apostasia shenzhenica]|uniref:U-box domain-containing protein 2 n=1 Tax=Apostasia shenzhenica TaxID=1088818 RepID=A0A2I0BAB3_9ASPA|nr:U-box domain-containing protein 2 [Apostasia shenzhenica]